MIAVLLFVCVITWADDRPQKPQRTEYRTNAQASADKRKRIANLPAWKKLAKKGDPEAIYEMAGRYYYGIWGVKRNSELSIKLYIIAANKGNVNAMNALGDHYEIFGKESFEWYTKAAEKGCRNSQWKLADYYYLANGNVTRNEVVKMDKKKAIELLMKSASQNSPHAMLIIAKCYLRGNGLPLDKKKALEWAARVRTLQFPDDSLNGIALTFIYDNKLRTLRR